MIGNHRLIRNRLLVILCATLLVTGCAGNRPNATEAPTAIPTAIPTATPEKPLPKITGVEIDRMEVRRYELMEMKLGIDAEYTNPYDTWQGKYLETLSAACTEGQACKIALPDSKADMAFKVER